MPDWLFYVETVRMIAVLLALTGCWGDRSAAGVVADELCRWGQLEELTPSILPATVDLTKLVRDLDLKYASGEPPSGPSTTIFRDEPITVYG